MEKRSSIKAFRARNGFTLIELLVVVLIIGILAAVALPQYNKAVKKAHMAEALTIMDANSKDAQAYLLEHGEVVEWPNMINSYADLLIRYQVGSPKSYWDWNESKSFGDYFQVGSSTSPAYGYNVSSYCIEPKNGDEAYIHHYIDNTGKITRVCAGADCGKYVTGETCFAAEGNCAETHKAWNSGCSF